MKYDMIDRFLRNNLGDDDYAEYSAALDSLCAPQQKQEPVAWDGKCVLGHCGSPAGCEASNCCRADYTSQPQRQPLTDEEADEIQRSASYTAKGLLKAIEAKLKAKNFA
jgi:hypothetical protein